MSKLSFPKTIPRADSAIAKSIEGLRRLCNENASCFSMLSGDESIDSGLVDKTYDRLQAQFGHDNSTGSLVVILDSSGGDIDAAYNLAQLFRRYAPKYLEFVIPRWAKSAATLLACSGDLISMTPVAELGPLDPQITQMNPLEQRIERFSPLHIESTLALIRNEFENGNINLANGLLQRLQFPLTLGSFQQSLELGDQYVEKLLSTRMFKDDDDHDKAKGVATRLTRGYADHGFCINILEAQELGLKVRDVPTEHLTEVWNIHLLSKHRNELVNEAKRKEMVERLKELPQELLGNLPPDLRVEPDRRSSSIVH